MDFKPRLFIGSSTEGFYIAEKMALLLEDIAELQLWKNAFTYNVSFYDNLVTKIVLYDYAILVATADDTIISRHKKSASSRDNVLFEFGLFSGGLGRDRVFCVVQKNIKIPGDLLGIMLPVVSLKEEPDFEATIQNCAAEIKKLILGKEKTYDLGFLPSTALAYGYFVNFIERTVERLLEDKQEGKVFRLESNNSFIIRSLKFTVLIPDDLSDDMFKKVKAKRLKEEWQKLKVDPKDVRDYDFSIDISNVEDGLLHVVDIPLTLNALKLAVDFYSKKMHIGKDEQERLLEYREIRNFKRTLEYQIKTSSLTRGIVEVEVVDI